MKKKVLVVDDIVDNLTVINAMLKRWYSVSCVKSGQAALSAIERNKPDIILMDIMMPQMDGFEVFRVLRSDPLTSSIPVIFVSAKGQGQAAIDAISIGAKDYIAKPVVPDILLDKIERHIH